MHSPGREPHDPLEQALALAHKVLPDQGPIAVFIHHNTLHAFQHLSFHEGVQRGAELLGGRPYLSLQEFRAAYAAGRIEDQDLDAELDYALRGLSPQGEVLPGLSRRALWRSLLLLDVEAEDAHGLRFCLAGEPEVEARVEAFRAALERAARPAPPPRAPRRHRDVLLARGGRDTDEVLHPELVRLSAAFLDQGHARAAFPGHERGFFAAVASAVAAGGTLPRSCRGATADFARALEAGLRPEDVVREALEHLGVDPPEVHDFVLWTLLGLPGWGGMFSRLERFPAELHHPVPVKLMDFLAVRLLLERRAVEHACRELGLPGAWRELRGLMPSPAAPDPLLDAWLLASVWPGDPGRVDPAALSRCLEEVAAFPPLRRRALFQEAYERRYRRQILDGLAARRRAGLHTPTGRPKAQFVFCIDEREESIRRALEEQDPSFETFGAAGFFGVAIDYRGLDDREAAAHCPVVVTPAHEVHELPLPAARHGHALRVRLREAWHELERRVGRASRTLLGGAGLSVMFGPVAGAMATSRLVAPRSSLLVRDELAARLARRPATQLSSFREEEQSTPRGKSLGFSLDEAVARVAAMLQNLGLIDGSRLAPIVVVLGHGSTSLNNPHESAHDCGACGGRRGGANARLFAELANRPDVRAGLAARGIVIPDDTWFVGALHDTADDSVRYSDLSLVPDARLGDLERADVALQAARRESARERCRRFEDTPLSIEPEEALLHVEGRSSHLGQVRPEYGHCTNAVCIVGGRRLSRGLHLDRRAFLVSYEPAVDPELAILERILAAIGPVGAGISLEYYFSSVDNAVFGCGTKLPHNVTGLIGVMDGHQSDLRTGLPVQMVELHEPMRLLLIVEASPASLLTVAARQAEVRELVVNRWVQLVSLDPESGALAWFDREGFVPCEPALAALPVVERSPDWHMRTRRHVGPALIRAGLTLAAPVGVS